MTVHDARQTCATLLMDLEVHPRVIMRILRHADVSMTLEIYANACADGDKRSAPQAEGSPFDAQVNSRLCCCTSRIFAAVLAANEALIDSRGSLSPAETLVGVTGFEPAASSSRTSRNRNHVDH
jgi:Phage integrase family